MRISTIATLASVLAAGISDAIPTIGRPQVKEHGSYLLRIESHQKVPAYIPLANGWTESNGKRSFIWSSEVGRVKMNRQGCLLFKDSPRLEWFALGDPLEIVQGRRREYTKIRPVRAKGVAELDWPGIVQFKKPMKSETFKFRAVPEELLQPVEGIEYYWHFCDESDDDAVLFNIPPDQEQYEEEVGLKNCFAVDLYLVSEKLLREPTSVRNFDGSNGEV